MAKATVKKNSISVVVCASQIGTDLFRKPQLKLKRGTGQISHLT